MPIESIEFVTYYNIFEFAYPVCLLTVAATLVYMGVGIWKAKTPLLLPTQITTFLFALFLCPTFLHSVNHVTDTIENTTLNNALNWFGVTAIPLVLLLNWFAMPGKMVFGRSGRDTKRVLTGLLEKYNISYEEKGRSRLRTSIGTFVVKQILSFPIVLVYNWPPRSSAQSKDIFRDLEIFLGDEKSDSRGNSVRSSACTIVICGLLLGGISFVSWATSTLVMRPFSIVAYISGLF